MGLVETAVVDGVRTFWVDSGRPTLAATLMFRVGQADEELATSGWVHLLEHLTLHGLPRGTLAVNGSVSALVTTLSLHGPRDQVVAALADVSRRLAEPDLGELDRERRVLAAEAATRGGPVARAFSMRYGARGPGLVAWDDLGLGRARADELVALSRRVFSAGNATLALDGPPPEGLRLDLAPGDALPERPARPVERPRAVYPEGAGLVLSGVVPRRGSATMVPLVLEDALRRRLRERDGTAYSPYSVYEAVDADQALVVAGSDVSPATAPTLLTTVLDLADDLASHGPSADAHAEMVAAMRQAYTDPYNVGFLSHRAAAQALRGEEVQQLDELVDELDTETPEALAPALAAFRDSLLVGAPPATEPHARLRLVERPESVVTPRGRRFRSTGWPANGARLVVGDDALVIGDGRRRHRSAYDEVAGYLVWADGPRGLVTDDGWSLVLDPSEWGRGERAVALLDAAVPAERHLPQPAETRPASLPRPGLARRWTGGASRIGRTTLRSVPAALVWGLVVVLVAVLAVALGHPGLIGPLLVGSVIARIAGHDDD